MVDVGLTLLWIVIIGVVVGLLAWLGPRRSQWRSHERETSESENREDDDDEA